eukprot:COSAG01_NODE_71232_length_256_cov_1.000000_2_plen_35_part_01
MIVMPDSVQFSIVESQRSIPESNCGASALLIIYRR